MWPSAASGRMRSQTILVVAKIGAERIAPGTPHSQNQNTKEKTTKTGLRETVLREGSGARFRPSITWMAPYSAAGSRACQVEAIVSEPANRKMKMAAAGP